MHENLLDPNNKGEEMECTFASRLLDRNSLILTDDILKIFQELRFTFNDRFPKHFCFANFQCLRCGQRCNDQRVVRTEDIRRWFNEERFDILEHVYCYEKGDFCGAITYIDPCNNCSTTSKDIVTNRPSARCPFVRKVRNKPYYKCRIHGTKTEECAGYLCMKSVPVAHLNWNDVDELIAMIGLEKYLDLTKEAS